MVEHSREKGREIAAHTGRTETKGSKEMPGCEALCRTFIPFSRGDSCRESARCAPPDHPNLQLSRPTIRSRSGLSGSQWLCCSPFMQTAHPSRQNLLTLRAYYHGGKYPTKWVNLARKRGTLPSILDTGTRVPGQNRFPSGTLALTSVNCVPF
jgi:hypothetical protein